MRKKELKKRIEDLLDLLEVMTKAMGRLDSNHWALRDRLDQSQRAIAKRVDLLEDERGG